MFPHCFLPGMAKWRFGCGVLAEICVIDMHLGSKWNKRLLKPLWEFTNAIGRFCTQKWFAMCWRIMLWYPVISSPQGPQGDLALREVTPFSFSWKLKLSGEALGVRVNWEGSTRYEKTSHSQRPIGHQSYHAFRECGMPMNTPKTHAIESCKP